MYRAMPDEEGVLGNNELTRRAEPNEKAILNARSCKKTHAIGHYVVEASQKMNGQYLGSGLRIKQSVLSLLHFGCCFLIDQL